MIYSNTNASFNYPVFSNGSTAYRGIYFDLDIQQINEVGDYYVLTFVIELNANFVKELVRLNLVAPYLILESEDNFIQKIYLDQKEIRIPKSRLSLVHEVKAQVQLLAQESFTMKEATHLTSFYRAFKDQIRIAKYAIFGYSTIERFQAEASYAIPLFDYSIDEEMEADFEVKVLEEIISLRYKDPKLRMAHSKYLENMYLYIGMSRALEQFIRNYSPDQDGYVDFNQLDTHEFSVLERKLYDLMVSKNIHELEIESIDYVIDQISNQIIERYVEEVTKGAEDED